MDRKRSVITKVANFDEMDGWNAQRMALLCCCHFWKMINLFLGSRWIPNLLNVLTRNEWYFLIAKIINDDFWPRQTFDPSDWALDEQWIPHFSLTRYHSPIGLNKTFEEKVKMNHHFWNFRAGPVVRIKFLNEAILPYLFDVKRFASRAVTLVP